MPLDDASAAVEALDQERIKAAATEIILALSEDPEREGLRETPARIARMYGEVFAGIHLDPLAVLSTGFEEGHNELVVARDIPFYSMCEHHFLPFFGVAHIGYIPRGRIVGISKLARVTDILARRPQVQERLTSQIVEAIVEALQPIGAGVVIEAEHLCMMMRGVKKPGSQIVTSAMRGCFRTDAKTRGEFLDLAAGHRR